MRNKKLLGVLLSLGVLPFMPSMVDIVQAENKQVPATFEVTEGIVGGGLVVTIPDSLDMTKSDNGWYTSSGTVTAKGNINPSKRLKVSTDLSVTYAHKDKVGLGVLANVEFGTKGVSYFSVDELKANLTSPETKKVPVTTKVESSDIQYLGEYKSDIVFQVSVVDTEEDFSGYFTYKTYENTDKLVINGYSQEGYEKLGKKGNVELSIPLPSSYKGQEVIGVEFDASSDTNRIELVEGASMPTQHWIMPDNYTVFKCFSNYANGMEKLKSITLTDGLVELGEGALQGVVLEELIIPKGLKTLNSPAVLKGATIDVINFEEGFTEIAGDLLKGVTCRELNLPDSLVHITHNFLDGSSIEQLYLGENINYNEGYFYDESSSGYVLKQLDEYTALIWSRLGTTGVKGLKLNVDNWDNRCDCYSSDYTRAFLKDITLDYLELVNIPDDMDRCIAKDIVVDVFRVTPKGNTLGNVLYEDGSSFISVNTLILSDNIEVLPRRVFGTALGVSKDIVWSKNLKTIEEECFTGAEMHNVVLDMSETNITYIGDSAFSSLLGDNIEIILPNNLDYLGNYVISYSEGVTKITLPTKRCDYIGIGAFSNLYNITEVILPEYVTQIPEDCFSSCGHLERVVLSENLDYIEARAFKDCTSLTEVINFKDTIHMGDYVFTGCPFQPE